MTDKKGEGHSYFSVGRKRRKRNLMIIIPLAVAVSIIIGVFGFMGGPAIHSNQMVMHNHATLEVISNGISKQVPAHIGMSQVGKTEDPLLYGDHSLDKYGMQGMSPLHTHDASGTIHVESNAVRDYMLGELLDMWQGSGIYGKTVQATVNGIPVSDFRNIILKDGISISLNVS